MNGSVGENDFQHGLVTLAPNLRAFARTLCRNPDQADDLVQETLVKAWKHRDSFAPGSNLKAWLFTILRNAYLSERRKHKYEVADPDGTLTAQVSVKGEQSGHMELVDFAKCLEQLPEDQREALILIGAEGFSYEDAAAMCGCAVGTIKSRVNRARAKLSEMTGIGQQSDIGEEVTSAVNSRRSAKQVVTAGR